MSALERSKSPVMAIRQGPKEDIILLNDNKIHRIRSRRPFYAYVICAVSPSEIWIRITNHITEKLVKELTDPKKELTAYEVNDYCMTQVDEKHLARARILKKFQTGALVRFLDFGFLAYRNNDEFYIMEQKLWYYPWQTIQVALHDAHPAENFIWSKNEVKSLQEVFEMFPLVYVIPQNTDIWKSNNDSIPQRVKMNGVTPDEMEIDGVVRVGDFLGESILGLFNSKRDFVMDTPIDDAKNQQEYKADISIDLSYDPLKREIPRN